MMTLVLILLASVVLAGVARRSLSAALEASTAEQELRTRWASVTAQAALLSQAERLLSNAERREQRPLSRFTGQLELQGLEIVFIIGDEQSKVNVNGLLGRLNVEQATRAIRELALRSVRSTRDVPQVLLRPAKLPIRGSAVPGEPRSWPAIGSYGQIFANPTPAILLGSDLTAGGAADLTCWGDGRLHLRRASSHAIRQACAPVIGIATAQRLAKIVEDDPGINLDAAVASLELAEDEAAELRRALVDESRCHSVWLIVSTEQRRQYDLLIRESFDEEPPRLAGWSW